MEPLDVDDVAHVEVSHRFPYGGATLVLELFDDEHNMIASLTRRPLDFVRFYGDVASVARDGLPKLLSWSEANRFTVEARGISEFVAERTQAAQDVLNFALMSPDLRFMARRFLDEEPPQEYDVVADLRERLMCHLTLQEDDLMYQENVKIADLHPVATTTQVSFEAIAERCRTSTPPGSLAEALCGLEGVLETPQEDLQALGRRLVRRTKVNKMLHVEHRAAIDFWMASRPKVAVFLREALRGNRPGWEAVVPLLLLVQEAMLAASRRFLFEGPLYLRDDAFAVDGAAKGGFRAGEEVEAAEPLIGFEDEHMMGATRVFAEAPEAPRLLLRLEGARGTRLQDLVAGAVAREGQVLLPPLSRFRVKIGAAKPPHFRGPGLPPTVVLEMLPATPPFQNPMWQQPDLQLL
mmetsp:Transcript_46185/g.105360  ORF Transcript_46185/g.105360 Transcript_46185/m.105360 type:complete len:408 (-) Transcript_46185:45-1268(-)